MSGQALVDELRAFVAQWRKDTQKSDMIYGLMHTEDGKLVEDVISASKLDRVADTIEAQAKEIERKGRIAKKYADSLVREVGYVEEQRARAERAEQERDAAEQKSAELAAVIAEARDHEWSAFGDSDTHRILSAAVPADVLSAYTTRIREEALACEEVEYTFSEVLDDGTVAYSSPFATLEEAAEAQAKARMNYPWPEEIGLARRRAPGPWAVIPEGEDR